MEATPTTFVRKLLGLRLFFVINIVALFFLSLSFGREYLRNASVDRDIQELQQEKEGLEAHNLEILSLSESIQTQYFLEKEGRLKYGLSKPGESLVVIQEGSSTSTSSIGERNDLSSSGQEKEEETIDSIPNPKRWCLYFFDHTAYEALKNSYGE